MNESLSVKFITQLINDTIDGVLEWDYFSNLPRAFIEKSEDLKALVLGHAHSSIIEKKSFFVNDPQFYRLILFFIHAESMKDGSFLDTYELYHQTNETGECIAIRANQNDLVKLATVVRNSTSGKIPSNELRAESFMESYIKARSSQTLNQHSYTDSQNEK